MIGALGVGFLMGWVGSMPLAGAVSIFVFQRGCFKAGSVMTGNTGHDRMNRAVHGELCPGYGSCLGMAF